MQLAVLILKLQNTRRMLTRSIARSLCRLCLSEAQTYRARYSARPPRYRSMHATRRVAATPPPMVNVSDISMEKYHQLSDVTMDTLLERLENLLDEAGKSDYEVEYQSGVLTLVLGDKGTYVINKQPPNKQIWLSSPFSGPKRYDYVPKDDGWYYARDGGSMSDLLEHELGNVLGRKVELGLNGVSSIAESS